MKGVGTEPGAKHHYFTCSKYICNICVRETGFQSSNITSKELLNDFHLKHII